LKTIRIQDLCKEVRAARGITRDVMAQDADLSYGTVRKLEMSGDEHVAMTQINTMLKFLRLTGFDDADITFTYKKQPFRLDM